MDILVRKVVRTGGRVALVELEVAGIVLGFRAPGRVAYRYKEGARVLDADGLYIPGMAYAQAVRKSYGIFGQEGVSR